MMKIDMFFRSIILFTALLLVAPTVAQNKYQSLMWKISGNGCQKPSYLYGTMHISGKMVFHLGDPFYNAIESVDVVALELEPENWLKSMFEDPKYQLYMNNSQENFMDYYGYDQNEALPALKSFYGTNTDIQENLKNLMMYDPALLNYLLFRYGDYSAQADYEEDTWLDMYIYQTGKRMGKETLGLETYAQSDYYIRQARMAEYDDEDRKEFDDGDMKELIELQKQLEPAYRKQDLDLIDSLNKRTTSPGFDKYILVERNKVFLHNIDSVLKAGKSIFAGMGCAHLPGQNGIIEMLRGLGYQVEPMHKGERDAKRREKIDKQIFKRTFSTFNSHDGELSFKTPAQVYHLGADEASSSWICLDIPNGASFIVNRFKTYAGLNHRDQDDILRSIDSVLYEAIAGDIVSLKKVTFQNNPAIDIVNLSRRGDYQRRFIIVMPEEILLLKLSASGEKVKQGYGDEFFNSFQLNYAVSKSMNWTSPDKAVTVQMPGSVICYDSNKKQGDSPDFEALSSSNSGHDVFVVRRHVIEDPEFLDEDTYELKRLALAYEEDNKLNRILEHQVKVQGLPGLDVAYTTKTGNPVFARFVIQSLNYYAFSAHTSDTSAARSFLDKVRFNKIEHDEYFTYTDTSNYFKVQLPYVYKSSEDFSGYDRKDDDNIFKGKSGVCYLNPPGEADMVDIRFQRFHRFSDGEDTLKFYQEKLERITEPGMKVDKHNILWNARGCEMNFIVSDTACTRKYMSKLVLHNKTLYTLQTSYDSIFGPSDFVQKVFDGFTPTDTVYPFYHFVNMDRPFLDSLMSSDSTTVADAINIAGEMDFSAQSGPAIRKFLKDFPDFENKKDVSFVREKLTNGLAADTSAENIQYISQEFYRYSDSASYQLDLLRVLLRMRTKESWNAYKKLVLDEPPIAADRLGSTGFGILNDSLELAVSLIPDLLQLLALDEYESDVYHLLAESIDSSTIKPAVYKPLVDQITIEARNELKRLNGMKEKGYSFNTQKLIDYCTLLHPYRSKPEVQSFFDKTRRTKKMALLIDLVEFDLKHNVSVPDSLIQKLSTEDEQVIPLYAVLREHHANDKMPEKFKSHDALLKIYIKNKFKSGYGAKESVVDSIIVVGEEVMEIKGSKLNVSYCKYKKSRSKQWLGVVIAFDATDPKNLWPDFIETSQTIVLDADENDLEELRKEYFKLEESNRREINFGNGENRTNYLWY